MVTLIIAFFHFVSDFISRHDLGCIWVSAVFVNAIPRPGEHWTVYEVIWKFLNGLMVNIPSTMKGKLAQLQLDVPKTEVPATVTVESTPVEAAK